MGDSDRTEDRPVNYKDVSVLFRKHTTLIFLSVALTVLLAASGCVTQSPDTDLSGSGLEIGGFSTRLQKTEPDDLAQILDINRWKFSLLRETNEEVGLKVAMTIGSPGKTAKVIDEMCIFTTEQVVEGMVAIYPLGESLFNTDEVRIYMQVGGGSTSSVIPNPFKEFSSSYSANPADVLENKDLRLMAFSDTDPMPGPDNTVLSLRIETFSE
jgi:hypothetical protein